jgi:hypothetical protein
MFASIISTYPSIGPERNGDSVCENAASEEKTNANKSKKRMITQSDVKETAVMSACHFLARQDSPIFGALTER